MPRERQALDCDANSDGQEYCNGDADTNAAALTDLNPDRNAHRYDATECIIGAGDAPRSAAHRR